MIKAHGLSKKFGNFTAVDSVEFEIPQGAVVGFLGPNGAGKTTTIRMICGYIRPTTGRALIDGIDVARHARRVQQRLGYLPESAPLYTEMRVQEYLAFRGRMLGLRRAERRRSMGLAIDRCRIEEVRRRPIGQLSKGFRQRVGLAAALLHEPPILILDEPTAGLDPAQMREVRALIRDLAGRHTILLSTHNLAEVELSCDR
ncbi:MAG: ABC transporter ATP-binding protein, partial [Planctomycetota bacterium]